MRRSLTRVELSTRTLPQGPSLLPGGSVVSDKTYTSNVVVLNIKGVIAREMVDKANIPQSVMAGRIADKLAIFLTQHFLTTKVQEDGSVLCDLSLSVLVNDPPKGVACTQIIFRKKS